MSSWFPSIFSSDDNPSPESSSPATPSAGVKENVSTLFCGVAAFLPQPPPKSDVIAGMKNDFVEIKDALKSRLSLFSSKLTSNLLQFPRETNDSDDDFEEEDCVVGVTEEVVDFVGKISASPEIWTDFPISLPDDVDMSHYQREHASEIERLNEEDLKLLATPEVVKMRETILHMLQNKRAFEDSDSSEEDIEGVEESTIEHNVFDEALNVRQIVTNVDYDDSSLKESKNWDEFSFSDVEDDDNDLSRSTPSQIKKVLSTADAKEWIEVNENSESQIRDKELECEELDDWVTINYSDIDN
ncbi:Hypothetical predicted protein [Olea europaea subsp. europaea]|uniref:Uncharacterized protein n=1 Tax=Olea europaea subsp. europaea TaxID=158383 RepID=A0A8S0T9G5_OLEEU|nr:Hypothetical predicted protein [Olea europaea subsp. europaea]